MGLRHGQGQIGHLGGIGAIAAVAQKGVGVIGCDIGHGGAIGINAHSAQFGADQLSAQNHRITALIGAGQSVQHIQRRRPIAPMGRAQPLHTAPFLID